MLQLYTEHYHSVNEFNSDNYRTLLPIVSFSITPVSRKKHYHFYYNSTNISPTDED